MGQKIEFNPDEWAIQDDTALKPIQSEIILPDNFFAKTQKTRAPDGIEIKTEIKSEAGITAFINGEKILTDNSGNAPSALTKLDLVNPSGASPFYGNLKAVAVYKTALTDTELANLTSYNNHDLFIPYRSRMQMIGADQELQCTEHDITRFL